MPARGDRPFIDYDLLRPDTGRAPFNIWHQTPYRFYIIVKNVFIRRHSILYPHHELHIGFGREAAIGQHLRGLIQMRQIESFYLWFNIICEHLTREPIDQIRRVFINPRREVIRAHSQ